MKTEKFYFKSTLAQVLRNSGSEGTLQQRGGFLPKIQHGVPARGHEANYQSNQFLL